MKTLNEYANEQKNLEGKNRYELRIEELEQRITQKEKALKEAITLIDDFVMTEDHADFCGGDKWGECTCMDRRHFNPESNIKRSIEFLAKMEVLNGHDKQEVKNGNG